MEACSSQTNATSFVMEGICSVVPALSESKNTEGCPWLPDTDLCHTHWSPQRRQSPLLWPQGCPLLLHHLLDDDGGPGAATQLTVSHLTIFFQQPRPAVFESVHTPLRGKHEETHHYSTCCTNAHQCIATKQAMLPTNLAIRFFPWRSCSFIEWTVSVQGIHLDFQSSASNYINTTFSFQISCLETQRLTKTERSNF